MDITAQPQWAALTSLFESKKDLNLRELFANSASRAADYSFDAAGLHVDLSKNLIDEEVVTALVDLALSLIHI